MTHKELKQLSRDLINGKGKERLHALTEEEKAQLFGILTERYQESLSALRETMEEAKQVIWEMRAYRAINKAAAINLN